MFLAIIMLVTVVVTQGRIFSSTKNGEKWFYVSGSDETTIPRPPLGVHGV